MMILRGAMISKDFWRSLDYNGIHSWIMKLMLLVDANEYLQRIDRRMYNMRRD